MVVCCICKIATGTLKIKDGNPKYKGKPVCKECEVPFKRINNAVSFLIEDLRRDSGFFETENISYRNYDGNAE